MASPLPDSVPEPLLVALTLTVLVWLVSVSWVVAELLLVPLRL
jgi:hypothetical protein